MDQPPTLEGVRVRVRAAAPADLDAVFAIANESSVSEWWEPPIRAELADELYGGAADVVSLVIEAEGAIAGLVQYHEETTPEFRHAGIDIFLGSAWQGRGLGGEADGAPARSASRLTSRTPCRRMSSPTRRHPARSARS